MDRIGRSRPLPELGPHVQRQLFPRLAADLGSLLRRLAWVEQGRPPLERIWLFHAFLAKRIQPFPTTAALQTRPPQRLRDRLGVRPPRNA